MSSFSHPPFEEEDLGAGASGGNKPGSQPTPTSLPVDDSHAMTTYTNFCRITGTPEEVFLDLGVNLQPFGQPTSPIVITQRIVMNYYTAKRLLQVLHLTVQRHETAFGVLEIDVQKRVRRGPGSPAGM